VKYCFRVAGHKGFGCLEDPRGVDGHAWFMASQATQSPPLRSITVDMSAPTISTPITKLFGIKHPIILAGT
jgi:hypothetical protein